MTYKKLGWILLALAEPSFGDVSKPFIRCDGTGSFGIGDTAIIHKTSLEVGYSVDRDGSGTFSFVGRNREFSLNKDYEFPELVTRDLSTQSHTLEGFGTIFNIDHGWPQKELGTFHFDPQFSPVIYVASNHECPIAKMTHMEIFYFSGDAGIPTSNLCVRLAAEEDPMDPACARLINNNYCDCSFL